MIALVGCEDALYVVEVAEDADEDELVERRPGEAVERARRLELVPPWARETFVDVDAVGSTIVLAVDHRPPLLVSHDGGITWNERGAGLGRARAVTVERIPTMSSSPVAIGSGCPMTAECSGARSASSCPRSSTSPGSER